MLTMNGLYIAKGSKEHYLHLPMANRHGLIAGATGTGKTVTLKVLAESFSDAGVPVFMADVKGDLSGISEPGISSDSIDKRLAALEIEHFSFQGYPTLCWDIYGEKGIPLRTTISEIGPLLLSQILELNDTQESVLEMIFRIADDNGWLLLDYKDLKELLSYVYDHAKDFKSDYGNIAGTSIATIQRRLIALENDGFNEHFFGEEALDIRDFIKTDIDGRGTINILRAERLYQKPKLYATFLLWLLAELFEELPEAGDLKQPKLVFFFDEAHLLFNNAPKALTDKIEQVVRLIRSKGVGIYFITQSPADIPDAILGQLGNRVQHALRAYTPRDQKAVRAAADSFRSDGQTDIASIITELKVGEAVVSFLDTDGAPQIAERASVLPPMSAFGPAEENKLSSVYSSSSQFLKYKDTVDRESAFELLQARITGETERLEAEKAAAAQIKQQKEEEKQAFVAKKESERLAAAEAREAARQLKELERQKKEEEKNDMVGQLIKTAGRAATSSVGRQIGSAIVRGLFGSLLKK